MKSTLINLSLLKLGWVACVFGAAAGRPELGAITVAAITIIHLVRTDQLRAELPLLLTAALVGLVWESILVSTRVLDYGDGSFTANIAPYWIVGMWVLFATTLNVGMRWLRKSTALAAVFGGVGGPISFLAGEKAGAVTFSDPLISLLVIGIGWAVILPMIVGLARVFEEQTLRTAGETAS